MVRTASRRTGIIVLLAALLLAASCTQRATEEPATDYPTFRVYLPSVMHGCGPKLEWANYVQAVARCSERILRQRVEEHIVIMPDACATPLAEDYLPVPMETPGACFE